MNIEYHAEQKKNSVLYKKKNYDFFLCSVKVFFVYPKKYVYLKKSELLWRLLFF